MRLSFCKQASLTHTHTHTHTQFEEKAAQLRAKFGVTGTEAGNILNVSPHQLVHVLASVEPVVQCVLDAISSWEHCTSKFARPFFYSL